MMFRRGLIHLPWISAVLLLTSVFGIEVFLARPREAEAARESAIESIRASLSRDLSLIESAIDDGSLEQVREFVSASSALSGMEEMILLEPSGQVLAASDIALEGRPLPEGENYGDWVQLLKGASVTEVRRLPGDNRVETWASVGFPIPGGGLRSYSQGLLYTRWNLEPVLDPMFESTRGFAAQLFLLLIVTALPLQFVVYWFVTRRLQRISTDVQAFGRGERAGLFRDELPDQIGALSTLLREATSDVAERELAAQRLALALESANAGVWDWDVRENTITTNAQYHIMLGDESMETPIPAAELMERVHPDDVDLVRTEIRAVVRREKPFYNVEFRARARRNPHYTWIRSTGRVVAWGENGTAARMLGQHIDISEQKAARAHEADLARILDDLSSEVQIFALDNLRFLSGNRTTCAHTGYTQDELRQMTVLDITEPEQRPSLERALQSLRAGESLYLRHASRQLRKGGGTYQVEALIQVQTFHNQPAFVAIVEDISGRVTLQRRFQKLFEGVAHATLVFDGDARVVMTNQVGARLFLVSPEELSGRTLEEFAPEFHDLIAGRIGPVLGGRSSGQYEDCIFIGGRRRWFHSIMQPLEDDGGRLSWVQMICYETTEKKEDEARIQAQQERYRTLVESTSAILWEGDPATFEFTFVNQEAEKVLGYPAEQWVGDPEFWPRHIHPADREWAVNFCMTATEAGEEHTFEYRMIAADGRAIWLRDIVSVICVDGRPAKLVGVMIDISREKREEERFQAAFESIPIGNIVIDDKGVIQLANPAAREMFGYTADELAGNDAAMLVPEEDRGRHGSFVQNYLETGATPDFGSLGEIRGLRKNGEIFPLRMALGEIRDSEPHTFVGSLIDLSHVKGLEAQLVQSQKMEAVGQLAGGIAHDFNNLLHVINGFTEIARSTLPPGEPVQEELTQIAMAGERAASLTGQLLAFSRRQVMAPDNLDVNKVIATMGNMLRRVIGEHIHLEVIASPRLGRVYADRGMIEQVLMNLCVNARDAMPAGGRLSIETENVLITEDYCRDHVWAIPGRYVLASVTDTGCGMDRETAKHVFEPFFTTKGMHQGTGLGLSMVYGIVKQHGGMIGVYSEVNKGTTFKVYLPHSERAAEDVGTKIEGEVPRGTETILVVEDDEAVRGLTRAMLEAAGYTVLEAEDGRRALERFSEHHAVVHLALLDVVMPGMGGREAYNEMLRINPGLKALFASGYSENAIHTNFVLDSGLVLLKKPYSRDDLLRAIRRILDQ